MTPRIVKQVLNRLYQVLGTISLMKLWGEPFNEHTVKPLEEELERLAKILDGKIGRRCIEEEEPMYQLEVLRVEALWMATRLQWTLDTGRWESL